MISKFLNLFTKNSSIKKDLELKALLGKNILINKRKNYSNIENINSTEEKIFSQNGEDGIIDYLLETLNIQDPKFIEIGVEDYIESNTRLLYHIRNSIGLIIDNNIDEDQLSNNLDLWKGRIKVIKELISPNNINEIINDNSFDKNLDLFSIDIDGLDYWVIKELPANFSKICIAEYNPLFGSELEITVPNINNFDRTKYHYSNLCWGMSLKALIAVMNEKNFVFLGTNNLKNNAFFINEELKDSFKKIILNQDLNFDNYIDHKFRESRDRNGKLSYLSRDEQIKKIADCYVVNVKKNINEKIKLSNLLKI